MAQAEFDTVVNSHLDGIKAELTLRWTAQQVSAVTKTLVGRCKGVVWADAETMSTIGIHYFDMIEEAVTRAYADFKRGRLVGSVLPSGDYIHAQSQVKRDLTLMLRLESEERYQKHVAKTRAKITKSKKNDKGRLDAPHWTWWRDLPRAKFPLKPGEALLDDTTTKHVRSNLESMCTRIEYQLGLEQYMGCYGLLLHWQWWTHSTLKAVSDEIQEKVDEELLVVTDVVAIMERFTVEFTEHMLDNHFRGIRVEFLRAHHDMHALARYITQESLDGDIDMSSSQEDTDDQYYGEDDEVDDDEVADDEVDDNEVADDGVDEDGMDDDKVANGVNRDVHTNRVDGVHGNVDGSRDEGLSEEAYENQTNLHTSSVGNRSATHREGPGTEAISMAPKIKEIVTDHATTSLNEGSPDSPKPSSSRRLTVAVVLHPRPAPTAEPAVESDGRSGGTEIMRTAASEKAHLSQVRPCTGTVGRQRDSDTRELSRVQKPSLAEPARAVTEIATQIPSLDSEVHTAAKSTEEPKETKLDAPDQPTNPAEGANISTAPTKPAQRAIDLTALDDVSKFRTETLVTGIKVETPTGRSLDRVKAKRKRDDDDEEVAKLKQQNANLETRLAQLQRKVEEKRSASNKKRKSKWEAKVAEKEALIREIEAKLKEQSEDSSD